MKYFKHNGPIINLNAKNIKNNNIINILYAKNNIGCGQKQGLRLLSSQSQQKRVQRLLLVLRINLCFKKRYIFSQR